MKANILHVFVLSFIFIFSFTGCSRAQSKDDLRYKPETGVYTCFRFKASTEVGFGISPFGGLGTRSRTNLRLVETELGHLELDKNGTYSMPTLGYSGNWKYIAVERKLEFSGPLKDVVNSCSTNEGSYVIYLEIPFEDGSVQGLSYRKIADNPIPDLEKPNGNFTGKIWAFSEGQNQEINVATGKILNSYPSETGGWSNKSEKIIHLYGANPSNDFLHFPQIQIRDKEGEIIHSFHDGNGPSPDWKIKNYWFAEVSPNGDYLVLSGMNSSTTSDISVIDIKGNEILNTTYSGNFSASWLDDEHILYQKVDQKLVKKHIKTGKETIILDRKIKDAIAAYGGEKIAYAAENHVYVFNTISKESNILKIKGDSIDFAKNLTGSFQFNDDNTVLLMALRTSTQGEFLIFLCRLDGSEMTIVSDAQGDAITFTGAMLAGDFN